MCTLARTHYVKQHDEDNDDASEECHGLGLHAQKSRSTAQVLGNGDVAHRV